MPRIGPLLAIDLSKRRIGCAACDPDRLLATPLTSWRRTDWLADVARIRDIGGDRRVTGIVMGYPLNMDGSVGPAAQSRRDSATRLARALPAWPVMLQDERLTTAAVEEAFADGRWRRPKPPTALDHYAAAIILEDAIRAIAQAHREREEPT